jgi:hypothetical protein
MTNNTPKRTPLRWLTLAEIVGIVALGLTGLGYWDAHRDRVEEHRVRAEAEQERAAAARDREAERKAAALAHSFVLTGSPSGSGDLLRLAPAHAEQVIQTQTLWFPAVVRADKVDTTGNPRIEAGWIAAGLPKAAGKARHGRVPVGIETVYIEDGETKTDRAVYQMGYGLHPRFLRGTQVQLEGLSLSRRGVSEDLQFAADNLWARR